MPAPSFGSVGAQLAGSSASTANYAVPASVASGDILLAFVYTYISGGGSVTPPAGFTEAPNSPAISGAFDERWRVYWKRATGNDSGTYNFTLTGTVVWRTGVVARYTGCITSGSPIDVSTSAGTTSPGFPNTSITTLGTDRLIVWTGGSSEGWDCTQPSGYTENFQGSIDNSNSGECLASLPQAAAGSTGTLSATLVSGSGNVTLVWLAALLPADTGAASTSLRIPNRNVGPMALRRKFRQVLQQAPDAPTVAVAQAVAGNINNPLSVAVNRAASY